MVEETWYYDKGIISIDCQTGAITIKELPERFAVYNSFIYENLTVKTTATKVFISGNRRVYEFLLETECTVFIEGKNGNYRRNIENIDESLYEESPIETTIRPKYFLFGPPVEIKRIKEGWHLKKKRIYEERVYLGNILVIPPTIEGKN